MRPRRGADPAGTGSDAIQQHSGEERDQSTAPRPLADRVRAALERLGIVPPPDLPRFDLIRLPGRRWLLVTDVSALVGDWSTGAVIQVGGGR